MIVTFRVRSARRSLYFPHPQIINLILPFGQIVMCIYRLPVGEQALAVDAGQVHFLIFHTSIPI